MQPFYRIGDHIYIVPTPKLSVESSSCIENLFSPETLNTVIDGKTFNIDEDTDGTNHYGKFSFAKMVKSKEKTTDFSGFLPFLGVVNDIVANHGEAGPAI
jgi:RNA-directed DNA polymerase